MHEYKDKYIEIFQNSFLTKCFQLSKSAAIILDSLGYYNHLLEIGWFKNKYLFLIVLEGRNQDQGAILVEFLVNDQFLVYRGLSPCCVLTWCKEC